MSLADLWHRMAGRPAARREPSPLRPCPAGNGHFVFIHINKTGGTSIGQALGLPVKQHLTAREVIAIVGRDAWSSAFRFAIVRNPWSKVVSHYKHRVKTKQTGMGDQPVPFAEWVARTYGPAKDPALYDQPKMFQPQVDWLRDDRGQVDVDFVGRFEDIASAYAQIAGRVGATAELPHLNRTERTDFRAYYEGGPGADAAATVGAWFAEDVGRFGYSFDPPK